MARPKNNAPLILLIIFVSNSKIVRADDWIPDGVTVFPTDSEGYGPYGELRLCEESGKFVSPEDCSIYYECGPCDSDSGFCYKEESCPSGATFDNSLKKCVHAPVCPQQLPDLPSGWTCDVHEGRKVNPETCDQFYLCIECGKSDSGWCYWLSPCLPGQIFDESEGKCVDGECGVEPPTLPTPPPTVPTPPPIVPTSPPPPRCLNYFKPYLCDWYLACSPIQGFSDRCTCAPVFCGFGRYWNRDRQNCEPGKGPYSDCINFG